ncbi:MAG: hypothetical protein U5L45_02510 [Saprospiraceae bacterium]|nr:hypothetical protein [Saprospiraceae bacterium]
MLASLAKEVNVIRFSGKARKTNQLSALDEFKLSVLTRSNLSFVV